MKFIDRLTRFMYGRYGNDNLNRFIAIFAFLIAVVNIFIDSIIIYLISLSLFIVSFLRMLSKNRYARSKENKAYLKITRKFIGFFKLTKNKWRDRKTHAYKKCPVCKAVLRLPKKKGKHIVNCPKCHNRFDINI